MKKILILLLSIFLLCACSKKEDTQYDQFGNIVTADPVSDDEKVITIVNQCITDYNEGNIDEKQNTWNVNLPDKPIGLDNISLVENINQLESIEDNTTNADYIYLYDIDNYQMKFKLFSPFNEFYLDGELSYIVNVDNVSKDNPSYKNEKKLLDSLLAESNNILNLLYGLDVELGNESKTNAGYYEFVSFNNQSFNSIDQIKNYANKVYANSYLEDIYKITFEGDDPIYINVGKKLYVRETDTVIKQILPYDTSYILNCDYHEDSLDIDILISYGEYPVNEVHRISLVKENGNYKLYNLN